MLSAHAFVVCKPLCAVTFLLPVAALQQLLVLPPAGTVGLGCSEHMES